MEFERTPSITQGKPAIEAQSEQCCWYHKILCPLTASFALIPLPLRPQICYRQILFTAVKCPMGKPIY